MNESDRVIFIQRLADQALTAPMSVESLADYFLVNWRTMKSMLLVMEGAEQFGKLWRVPVRKMPPRYLQEQKLS